MLQFDILGAPRCRVSFFRMLENNKLTIVRTPPGDTNVNEATKKTNELRIYKGGGGEVGVVTSPSLPHLVVQILQINDNIQKTLLISY
jgi:hypothetical protein